MAKATGATFAIGVASPGVLVTEWSSADPDIARVLTRIAAMPLPQRLEAQAQLHMAEARWCWQRAALLRADAEDSMRRRGRRGRGTCVVCGRTLSVSSRGLIRPHNAPAGQAWLATDNPRCPGSGQLAEEELAHG